jgi:hypothetical protein
MTNLAAFSPVQVIDFNNSHHNYVYSYVFTFIKYYVYDIVNVFRI